MLPGVELARRRRVHYHGDVASAAGTGEHVHHHYAHAPAPAAGPALAARIRLEEKLRGAALPSTAPSRWSRLMRDGRSARGNNSPRSSRRVEQDAVASGTEPWRPPAPADPTAALLQVASATVPASASTRRRRAELTRTLSKVDVCAVCLDEVRERCQRVTRLPCSHKYHSECVLPWLAIHPDCPCCRALVPSLDTLDQV